MTDLQSDEHVYWTELPTDYVKYGICMHAVENLLLISNLLVIAKIFRCLPINKRWTTMQFFLTNSLTLGLLRFAPVVQYSVSTYFNMVITKKYCELNIAFHKHKLSA